MVINYEFKELTSFRASDGNNIRLECWNTVPSTADLAREYAMAGKPDRYVVFSEGQTKSPIIGTRLSDGAVERGVFISCILRPSFFPSQAGLLAPLSAVALLGAFEEHTTKKDKIGWVSDIYYEGQKIGGCSIEGKLDSFSSYEYMIVSFALRLDNKFFTPRLTDMISKVFDEDNPSIAMIITKTILNKFFDIYIDMKNPAKHMNTYKQRFLHYDQKIKYIQNDKKFSGKVVDVDKNSCALIVMNKSGETAEITSPSAVISISDFNLLRLLTKGNK